MSDMQLVKSAEFDGIVLDCYINPAQTDKGDFWATREQIGQLLGYSEPRISISNIHQRNKERLDKFSCVINLITEAGIRTATVYNFKGLLEVCRYSQQPKANAVMDWLFEVADEIRRTGSYISTPVPAIPTNTITEGAALFELAGLSGNQLILALDKLYKSYTGRSALQAANIELPAPSQKQLLTPTEIGKQFGLSAKKVNDILAGAGYQHKIANMWEPLGEGKQYAVMMDTGKKHTDGVPVRQLKWDSAILEVMDRLLDPALEEASA